MVKFLFKNLPAILAVLLLHVVAFVVASLPGEPAAPPPTAAGPAAAMAFATGAFAVPEAHDWCRQAVPAIFALPNYRIGFSGELNWKLPPAYRQSPGRSTPVRQAAPPPASVELPEPRIAATLPAAPLPLYASLRNNVSDKAPPRLPETVLWTWADGHPLPWPVEIDRQALAKAFEAGRPQRDTRVELVRVAGRISVRLSQSCGNPALDQQALAALGRRMFTLEGWPAGSREVASVFPPGQQLRTIAVEWRLLPANGNGGGA